MGILRFRVLGRKGVLGTVTMGIPECPVVARLRLFRVAETLSCGTGLRLSGGLWGLALRALRALRDR